MICVEMLVNGVEIGMPHILLNRKRTPQDHWWGTIFIVQQEVKAGQILALPIDAGYHIAAGVILHMLPIIVEFVLLEMVINK
jgi:hypothetical protein